MKKNNNNKMITIEKNSEDNNKLNNITQNDDIIKLGKKSYVDKSTLVTNPRKNRDSLIILYHILMTTKSKADNGINYKTLIYEANTSSTMLKRYLTYLLNNKFIERIEIQPTFKYRYKSRKNKIAVVFRVTEKGNKYIKIIEELKELLGKEASIDICLITIEEMQNYTNYI
jgi:predicted transcriptional regulator